MKHQSSNQTSASEINEWGIIESTPDPERYALHATLFAQGNGFLGVRGTFEEGLSGQEAERGCYLNGIYFSEPIQYGESAYGYARNNERIASAPDPFALQVQINNKPLDISVGSVTDYHRFLDLQTGMVERSLVWQSPEGQRLRIRSRRLVSLAERDLALLEYEITALDTPVSVVMTPELIGLPGLAQTSDDPRVGSAVNPEDLESLRAVADMRTQGLAVQLRSSGFRILTQASHRFESVASVDKDWVAEPHRAALRASALLQPGEALKLTRHVAYAAYRPAGDEPESELEANWQSLQQRLDTLSGLDFEACLAAQRAELAAFWRDADIDIDGNPSLQQGLRFNLFHLYQSVGRDGFNNIAAKGLTGHGYDGHYFWDTEIYILPFFLYTRPELARNLLMYRYSILDAARERAREMNIERGCLFPWRTIGGSESSAYYPAGTAQYHINADIAHAVRQYHAVTGDDDFMRQAGAELVLESARMWLCLGYFAPNHDNRFVINGVTGPDEYTAIVNNNYFTNLMAQAHLEHAVELTEWLRRDYPEDADRLLSQLAITDEEISDWVRAARQMYLPRDADSGLHLQDDSFLHKQPWDFANTPADHYPLLLHYHPLVIYRHQVCKQADLVLAMLLLGDRFSEEEKRRNFAYYEAVTTHDSTLSACIHSILAAELGYDDKAAAYFSEVARMDLDNHHGNTEHGVHTACMGGTWLCMVQGFAGMRPTGDGLLRFRPRQGAGMSGYRFRLRHRGCLLELQVGESDQVVYRLPEGGDLIIYHDNERLELSGQTPFTRPLVA
ncbi:MAG: hypothetical protein LAT62_14170 [Natronospirillum sp.]|uniref:glycoside hydrolase family 65 protein n=1 Tax=Natronospirillum sp. TaxID=2812955 RepID=UPI0025EE7CB0|nr:glycosyl hydrolase family 65 protein [Natronospirillum sp.]MCH8553079.1 hypothetical protein [Natronospirillum sp.]